MLSSSSVQLSYNGVKVGRSIILLNIKSPTKQPKRQRWQWQGTKTPSGDRIKKKKNLGKTS